MVVLDYQRMIPHGSSATRQKVAVMLRIAAIGLVAFALFVGWEVFYRFVMEWRVIRTLVRMPTRPYYYYTTDTVLVYHWNQLFWMVAAMLSPLLLACVYWFLAGAILRQQDRTTTIAALALTMLHTLAATLCLLLFIMLGSASVRFLEPNLTALIEAMGCLLTVAMVPGMCYVSIRLMDLLKERPIYPVPGPCENDPEQP